MISVFDALMMSKELRESLAYALKHPEEFQVHFIEKHEVEEQVINKRQPENQTAYVSERARGIIFTDNDLLLGTADHNRPLYITGECEEKRLTRIFVDAGSSINIMPLKTVHPKNISIFVAKSQLMDGLHSTS